MDIRAYKLATPVSTRWPGSAVVVRLRPLALAELQAAELEAAEAPPLSRPMHFAAARVARAIEPRAATTDILALCTPEQLLALQREQARAQRHAVVGDVAKLKEWLRRSVNDIADVMDDGAACWRTEAASEYYGRPMATLTPAQLLWWLLLRSAFHEFHVEQKKFNGRLLAADYEQRTTWQIPD